MTKHKICAKLYIEALKINVSKKQKAYRSKLNRTLSAKKMKNQKQKRTFTLLYIVICFLIVMGSAKLMTMALESFEQSHRVEAESLPELPVEINQNQTTKLLEDGYLTD